MNIAADSIRLLHICLILFVLVVPFCRPLFAPDSPLPGLLILLEAVILPAILLHWVTNQSTCCLTMLECSLRDVPVHQTFMHQLLDPVYRFVSNDHLDSDTLKPCMYIIVIVLWFKSLYELHQLDWKPVHEIVDTYTQLWVKIRG